VGEIALLEVVEAWAVVEVAEDDEVDTCSRRESRVEVLADAHALRPVPAPGLQGGDDVFLAGGQVQPHRRAVVDEARLGMHDDHLESARAQHHVHDERIPREPIVMLEKHVPIDVSLPRID
jgi:hypothetical protein